MYEWVMVCLIEYGEKASNVFLHETGVRLDICRPCHHWFKKWLVAFGAKPFLEPMMALSR